MEDFKAMVKDTLAIRNPPGTWQHGRNMLKTKNFRSITNEDGLSFEYNINGTIIGSIITPTDKVFFSKNEDGTDEIGRVRLSVETPVYETILKSTLFGFKINCPIEGVFYYNFKGDLIVSWADGIKDEANKPYLMNLDTPPVTILPNKTLANAVEFTKLRMFPDVQEGTMVLTKIPTGSIEGDAIYITYSYVFDLTQDSTNFFPVSDFVYLKQGEVTLETVSPILLSKTGVDITLTKLDTNFKSLKLGIVISNGGTLTAFESPVFDYTGDSFNMTLVAIDRFTSIDPSFITISKTVFERIETFTSFSNRSVVGNTVTKPAFDFQKYANLLELKPIGKHYPNSQFLTSEDTLLPDEVYAFYMEVEYLDGTYSDAFHVPNLTPVGTETNVLTGAQKADYDLNTFAAANYKQFHLFNTGILNLGNPTTSKFGYWENKEVYPNTDDYNSTIDYQGAALSGPDLRGTPIKYHRVPSVEEVIKSSTVQHFYAKTSVGVVVTNFDAVIPTAVKAQIQGYRLSFVKRTASNSYVAGNWGMTRRATESFALNLGVAHTQGDTIETYDYVNFNAKNLDYSAPLSINFQKGRVFGVDLFKFKPSINVTHVAFNYLQPNSPVTAAPPEFFAPIRKVNKYSLVEKTLTYKKGNNGVEGTQHREEGINIDLEKSYTLVEGDPIAIGVGPGNLEVRHRNYLANITGFVFREDLYAGFKSSNLVVVGRVSKADNWALDFLSGDVFQTSLVHAYLGGLTYGPAIDIRYQQTTQTIIPNLFSAIHLGALHKPKQNITSVSVADSTGGDAVADPEILNAIPTEIKVTEAFGSVVINNLSTILTANFLKVNINKFPYRVNRSIVTSNESLSEGSLRTFLINDYYEMPNSKGDIIAIRASDRRIYIQHRYTLYLAALKDKLNTKEGETYLGISDIFSRPPEEFLSDDKGTVGSTSRFACQMIKGMYATLNQETGQIFLIKNDIKEISANGNKNWFWNNWDIGLDYYELNAKGQKQRIDNPYISVGQLIGYDKEYDRLLFTKKFFRFTRPDLLLGSVPAAQRIVFDGEFYVLNGVLLEFTNTDYFVNESITKSYSLEEGGWLFDHDYFPNLIYYTISDLYSITNKLTGINRARVYKHNDKASKGLYYGNKFESYIDLIFNGNLDITKLYQSILWVTTVTNAQGGVEQFKTITGLMLYNENQCSGLIDLKMEGVNPIKGRINEWSFNDFRDLLLDATSPIIEDSGVLNVTNINNSKIWFDKSNFISKFITVRLIVDNIDNNNVALHKVNVKSIITK